MIVSIKTLSSSSNRWSGWHRSWPSPASKTKNGSIILLLFYSNLTFTNCQPVVTQKKTAAKVITHRQVDIGDPLLAGDLREVEGEDEVDVVGCPAHHEDRHHHPEHLHLQQYGQVVFALPQFPSEMWLNWPHLKCINMLLQKWWQTKHWKSNQIQYCWTIEHVEKVKEMKSDQ